MKLTKKIVKSIGFGLIDDSSNPFYYHLKINHVEGNYIADEIIIGHDNDNKWSLRRDEGDCASFVRELHTLQDLVSAISEHSFKMGDRLRKAQIQKALLK